MSHPENRSEMRFSAILPGKELRESAPTEKPPSLITTVLAGEWDIPQPLPDDPDSLRIWSEARTGFQTDESGFLLRLRRPINGESNVWALSKLGKPWDQWQGTGN